VVWKNDESQFADAQKSFQNLKERLHDARRSVSDVASTPPAIATPPSPINAIPMMVRISDPSAELWKIFASPSTNISVQPDKVSITTANRQKQMVRVVEEL
jgi:hypothetical protein